MSYYAEYTTTLQELIENEGKKIFDFDDVVVYSNVINVDRLQDRFIKKYFFREIGYETYSMWKFKFKEMWRNRIDFYNILFEEYRNMNPRVDFKRTVDEILSKNIEFNEDSDASLIGTGKSSNESVERNTPQDSYDESDYVSFKGNVKGDTESEQTSKGKMIRETGETGDKKITIQELSSSELDILNKFVNGLMDIIERFLNEFNVLFMRIY